MIKAILKITGSVVVLAVVLWFADGQAVLAHLQDTDPVWLFLAFSALTSLTFLMSRRWQLTAHELSLELGYRHAVAEYYIAQLVNLILPGGVVGDISRAIRLRQTGDVIRAAQSVAAERILGQGTVFFITGSALSISMLLPGGINWPSWVWVGVFAVFAGILAALLFSRRATSTGRFLHLIFSLLRRPQLLSLSCAIAGLLIFSLYACARATGTILTADTWLTLLPLVLSAMLVPLSIAGWGWREGAAAALFPLVGATPSAGVAMGITYGAMMMIAALPGIFFMFHNPSLLADTTMERTSS